MKNTLTEKSTRVVIQEALPEILNWLKGHIDYFYAALYDQFLLVSIPNPYRKSRRHWLPKLHHHRGQMHSAGTCTESDRDVLQHIWISDLKAKETTTKRKTYNDDKAIIRDKPEHDKEGNIVCYPNLGLIISSVACNWLGKETNCGGILRTEMFTAAVARLPLTSDIVYEKESFPI